MTLHHRRNELGQPRLVHPQEPQRHLLHRQPFPKHRGKDEVMATTMKESISTGKKTQPSQLQTFRCQLMLLWRPRVHYPVTRARSRPGRFGSTRARGG